MKEYIEKSETYNKVALAVSHLTSFIANENLNNEEFEKLNNILNELLKMQFWIYDTPPAQVIEIPYKLGQKYYVRARTCSCGGHEEKGEFFPREWNCEDCWEKCDKELIVKEETFRSIDEMLWMKDYEGKTFWLHPEEVSLQ